MVLRQCQNKTEFRFLFYLLSSPFQVITNPAFIIAKVKDCQCHPFSPPLVTTYPAGNTPSSTSHICPGSDSFRPPPQSALWWGHQEPLHGSGVLLAHLPASTVFLPHCTVCLKGVAFGCGSQTFQLLYSRTFESFCCGWNVKRPSQTVFEHLVPSWWHCLGALGHGLVTRMVGLWRLCPPALHSRIFCFICQDVRSCTSHLDASDWNLYVNLLIPVSLLVPFTLEKPGEYACLLCLLCSYRFPESKFHEDQNPRYTSRTQNNKQRLRDTLHHWGKEWMKLCDQDKRLINMQRTGFLIQKTHFPNRKVLKLSRWKRKETEENPTKVTFLVDRPGCQKHFVWGVGACPCHSQESEQSCVDQVACLLHRTGISWCGVRCLP